MPSNSDNGSNEAAKEAGESSAARGRPVAKVRFMRILLIIAGTYFVVCLLVYIFQARLVYFPDRVYGCTPADAGMNYQAVKLVTADGLTLAAWYVKHPDPLGSVIFCHGNAGNISHRLATIKLLRSMRLNVLIFDYRGYGESEGSPDEEGLYRDAEAAWQYLMEAAGESPDRVVLCGRSLGGAVAIELAQRHPPAALIVESSFTSLVDVARAHYRFLPVNWILRHRYESVDKVPRIRCPKLFLHGKEDKLIPIKIGRRLFEEAADPKHFIETPGGHNNAGFTYSDEYIEMTAAFVGEALAGPN